MKYHENVLEIHWYVLYFLFEFINVESKCIWKYEMMISVHGIY